ncbi:MAG: hypothetical protein RDU20_02610 [Desulfomonilaceae bacterium]|nr:hypothetical protein [Desulfomonilaceae bacterium]
MDLDETKQVCGRCKDWGGNRELCEDDVVNVKASARGMCRKLNKLKPPQGACDNWEDLGGKEHG